MPSKCLDFLLFLKKQQPKILLLCTFIVSWWLLAGLGDSALFRQGTPSHPAPPTHWWTVPGQREASTAGPLGVLGAAPWEMRAESGEMPSDLLTLLCQLASTRCPCACAESHRCFRVPGALLPDGGHTLSAGGGARSSHRGGWEDSHAAGA